MMTSFIGHSATTHAFSLWRNSVNRVCSADARKSTFSGRRDAKLEKLLFGLLDDSTYPDEYSIYDRDKKRDIVTWKFEKGGDEVLRRIQHE